jgi:hypothetical protein
MAHPSVAEKSKVDEMAQGYISDVDNFSSVRCCYCFEKKQVT